MFVMYSYYYLLVRIGSRFNLLKMMEDDKITENWHCAVLNSRFTLSNLSSFSRYFFNFSKLVNKVILNSTHFTKLVTLPYNTELKIQCQI